MLDGNKTNRAWRLPNPRARLSPPGAVYPGRPTAAERARTRMPSPVPHRDAPIASAARPVPAGNVTQRSSALTPHRPRNPFFSTPQSPPTNRRTSSTCARGPHATAATPGAPLPCCHCPTTAHSPNRVATLSWRSPTRSCRFSAIKGAKPELASATFLSPPRQSSATPTLTPHRRAPPKPSPPTTPSLRASSQPAPPSPSPEMTSPSHAQSTTVDIRRRPPSAFNTHSPQTLGELLDTPVPLACPKLTRVRRILVGVPSAKPRTQSCSPKSF